MGWRYCGRQSTLIVLLLFCWGSRGEHDSCRFYLEEVTGRRFGLCQYGLNVEGSGRGIRIDFLEVSRYLLSKTTIKHAEVHCSIEIKGNSSFPHHQLPIHWVLSYQPAPGTTLEEFYIPVYVDLTRKKESCVSDVHVGYDEILRTWVGYALKGPERYGRALTLSPIGQSGSQAGSKEFEARCNLELLLGNEATGDSMCLTCWYVTRALPGPQMSCRSKSR